MAKRYWRHNRCHLYIRNCWNGFSSYGEETNNAHKHNPDSGVPLLLEFRYSLLEVLAALAKRRYARKFQVQEIKTRKTV